MTTPTAEKQTTEKASRRPDSTATLRAETINTCNLCGSDSLDLVALVDRDKQPLRTVICKDCGLVFTQKNRIDDIREFYAKDYRGSAHKKPRLHHVMRHGQNAVSRYLSLKSYLDAKPKLLDIGSGNGEFVYLMHSLGLDAKGIEPHEGLAAYSREELGIAIEVDFLEDYAARTTEAFDFVTLFHVLEHKEDPTETMAIIHQLMTPAGLLYIEVPDISARSISPQNVFHIEHIYNFNETTLRALAEKTGFDVVDVLTYSLDGNIGVVLKKSTAQKTPALIAPENYQQTFSKLRDYTPFWHYLSPRPYARLIDKIGRRINERWFTRSFEYGQNKLLLDALYRRYTA